MLYVVTTPIGNLADITFRAVEVLKRVSWIFCEDTRRSRVLMQRYCITTPLKSFHKFSERAREEEIISLLKQGLEIALISDAGTPGISDPGEALISRCHREGLPLTSLPGPSAPITALTLSGMEMERFQFIGFLPKKPTARKQLLIEALFYPGVTLFFESPSRINNTLSELAKWGADHELAIVREMTKLHEECLQGKAQDFIDHTFRGELVVVLRGCAKPSSHLSAQEEVASLMQTYALRKNEAIKLCAQMRGICKKSLYTSSHACAAADIKDRL